MEGHAEREAIWKNKSDFQGLSGYCHCARIIHFFVESREPFLLPAFALMQSWGHWRVAWRKEISSATSLNELTFLPMENPAAYSYLLFFLPTYLPDLACPFSVIFITWTAWISLPLILLRCKIVSHLCFLLLSLKPAHWQLPPLTPQFGSAKENIQFLLETSSLKLSCVGVVDPKRFRFQSEMDLGWCPASYSVLGAFVSPSFPWASSLVLRLFSLGPGPLGPSLSMLPFFSPALNL